MIYKLYSDNNKNENVIKHVLTNRNVINYKKYLNLDDSVLIHYSNLDNMDSAVDLFANHFENKNKIGIVIDSDIDGYCCGAMMYNYIIKLDNKYDITYIIHNNIKAHGLSDVVNDIDDSIKLLIIPDASTNDIKECKYLSEKGLDILILDHHEKEIDNPYALIVNNQISENYSNKNLCGAGVVYKFLQALDDYFWCDYADEFLDLFAWANISDIMDLREFETRYLTDLGLKNINNKFFKKILDSQEYSTKGIVNIHNIAWYITPIVNSLIRIGSKNDWNLLFRAFIETDEEFEYKKRATKNKPAEELIEDIYERAIRLCKNAKPRQDKLRDKCKDQIISNIEMNSDNNKVIIYDASDDLPKGLSGVVAIKIAEYFNKPCILLTKKNDNCYGGSARNLRNSPIDSFKDVVNKTSSIVGQGHSNAFGIVDFNIDNLNNVNSELNSLLSDVEYDYTYYIDYIYDIDEINVGDINDLSNFDNLLCQGIDEVSIVVKNIYLTKTDVQVIGKKEDVITFVINDIKYVYMNCKDENPLYNWVQTAWDDEDNIKFNIVGTPQINTYNNIKIPQILIKDVEIINSFVNDIDEDW